MAFDSKIMLFLVITIDNICMLIVINKFLAGPNCKIFIKTRCIQTATKGHLKVDKESKKYLTQYGERRSMMQFSFDLFYNLAIELINYLSSYLDQTAWCLLPV